MGLNYNSKRIAVAMVALVVLLEVVLFMLFTQNNVDVLRRMIVLFLAIMLGSVMPVIYHFELPRFYHPKFKLSLEDFLGGVFIRSILLGVVALAVTSFGTIGLLLALGAQLALTVYSVYLVVWKL